MMKMITICIPCYNEEPNIKPMAEALTKQMKRYKGVYDYEIIFRDNCSTDNSAKVFREIASTDSHIKVIINARNYGINPLKNSFEGRVSGDVIISLPADFQSPPELIPEFIEWWEKGYEVVCGYKPSSEENRLMFSIRQLFYKLIAHYSDIPQYNNMTGITLMSRRIFEIKRECGGDVPFRYFISELGCPVKLVPYVQQKRRAGKSSYNFWRYLTFAINSMIATSTVPLRIATVAGFVTGMLSFILGIAYLVIKLILWNRFSAGIAPVLIGMFFIGSVQLFFIGVVGEYVGGILHKVSERRPPIVKELINISTDDEYYIRYVDEKDNYQ